VATHVHLAVEARVATVNAGTGAATALRQNEFAPSWIGPSLGGSSVASRGVTAIGGPAWAGVGVGGSGAMTPASTTISLPFAIDPTVLPGRRNGCPLTCTRSSSGVIAGERRRRRSGACRELLGQLGGAGHGGRGAHRGGPDRTGCRADAIVGTCPVPRLVHPEQLQDGEPESAGGVRLAEQREVLGTGERDDAAAAHDRTRQCASAELSRLADRAPHSGGPGPRRRSRRGGTPR
jgi:hypothetical protein